MDRHFVGIIVFAIILLFTGIGNTLSYYDQAYGQAIIGGKCTPYNFDLSNDYWTTNLMIELRMGDFYNRPNKTQYYYKFTIKTNVNKNEKDYPELFDALENNNYTIVGGFPCWANKETQCTTNLNDINTKESFMWNEQTCYYSLFDACTSYKESVKNNVEQNCLIKYFYRRLWDNVGPNEEFFRTRLTDVTIDEYRKYWGGYYKFNLILSIISGILTIISLSLIFC